MLVQLKPTTARQAPGGVGAAAVLVDAVARHLGGARVDEPVEVVAVDVGGVAVLVGVDLRGRRRGRAAPGGAGSGPTPQTPLQLGGAPWAPLQFGVPPPKLP